MKSKSGTDTASEDALVPITSVLSGNSYCSSYAEYFFAKERDQNFSFTTANE